MQHWKALAPRSAAACCRDVVHLLTCITSFLSDALADSAWNMLLSGIYRGHILLSLGIWAVARGGLQQACQEGVPTAL